MSMVYLSIYVCCLKFLSSVSHSFHSIVFTSLWLLEKHRKQEKVMISWLNLTALLQSHNSYSAPIALEWGPQMDYRRFLNALKLHEKLHSCMYYQERDSQIWGGVQDSKVRHILYQAPLQYFGTMLWVGVGVAFMPKYINMQKQTQEHKCLS